MNPTPPCDRLVTDSLGFRLYVMVSVGDYPNLGQHLTHEDPTTGKVQAGTIHRINIKANLDSATLVVIVTHEVYHLFYSVRHLITVDEEAEAETFGELTRRVYAIAESRSKPAPPSTPRPKYWGWQGNAEDHYIIEKSPTSPRSLLVQRTERESVCIGGEISVAHVREWLATLPEEFQNVPFEACFGPMPCSLKRIVAYRAKDGSCSGVVANPCGTHLPFDDSLEWIKALS